MTEPDVQAAYRRWIFTDESDADQQSDLATMQEEAFEAGYYAGDANGFKRGYIHGQANT